MVWNDFGKSLMGLCVGVRVSIPVVCAYLKAEGQPVVQWNKSLFSERSIHRCHIQLLQS